MRTLSLKDAAALVCDVDLQSFFEGGGWLYPDPVPSIFIPADSGAKVRFARIVARTFLEQGSALLWITNTGVWPTAEHIDLFNGYRRSIGEARNHYEAPVHLFSASDVDSFISVFCLGLFFVWDMEAIAVDRSLAATVSHDEWFEYRVGTANRENLLQIEAKFAHLPSRGPVRE